jgi:glutathione S-transferase
LACSSRALVAMPMVWEAWMRLMLSAKKPMAASLRARFELRGIAKRRGTYARKRMSQGKRAARRSMAAHIVTAVRRMEVPMATLPTPATIIGGPVSPYVRKVLIACEMKGVPYQLDPIVPFYGDDRFSQLNPLRRVPVYIDDKVSVSDSTVICEYLDERFPSPALLPADPAERARARWIEEFADTRLGDVCIWRIFYEAVVNPFIWQKPRDKEKIARVVAEDLPPVMADVERLAPGDGFLFDDVSIADIAVAVIMRNLKWARVEPDTARWPRTCAWVERTTATPALAKITGIADRVMQTMPDQHRTVLAELGVPLTETTVGGKAPRRGPMTV